jgi:zinc protease
MQAPCKPIPILHAKEATVTGIAKSILYKVILMFRPKRLIANSCILTLATLLGSAAAASETNGLKQSDALLSTEIGGETVPLLDDVKVDFQRYKLENGLTVILQDIPDMKDVHVQVVYRVGSKDEPEGRSGFAHLFEHLMFQGTANRKGEFFSALEGYGVVDVNGTTTKDRTNFYQTVAPGALDRVLWLESDRMQHLMGGVTQKELDSQRAVVKNEKREREGNGSFEHEVQLLRAYYPEGHPYRQTTIGSMDDLNAATLEDVSAWYKRYYGASNAILLVAGNIDYDDVKKRIELYFSDVKSGERPPVIDEWIPTRDSVGRMTAYANVTGPSIQRTWPLPNNDARDTILLSGFVSSLMSGDRMKQVTKRLVEDEALFDFINLAVAPAEVASEFELRASIKEGVPAEKAMAQLDQELAKIFKQGVVDSEIKKYVKDNQVNFLLATGDPTIIPQMLLEGEWQHNDPLAYLNHLKTVTAAKPEEFRAAAQRWLTRPYFEQLTLPKGQLATDAKIAQTASRVDRSTIPAPSLVASDPVFPAVQTATLPSGAKLVVVPVAGRPIIEGAVHFDLGLGYTAEMDPATLLGFSLYGASITKSKAEKDLTRLKSELHANLYPSFNESGLTYRFTAIKPLFGKIVQLTSDVVMNPVFDDKEMAKDRAESEAQSKNDTYSVSADQLLKQALWGTEHPLGKLPGRDQKKWATPGELREFHKLWLSQKNMTVYLVGDISMDDARKVVGSTFGGWRLDPSPIVIKPLPAPKAPNRRIILLDKPDAAQSEIYAAKLLPAFDSEKGLSQRIANKVLGASFTSRINLNLREDKGWSYGARSEIEPVVKTPQTLIVGARVEVDKTAPAIAELQRELQEITTTRPINEAEFTQARDNYVSELRAFNLPPATVIEMLLEADKRGSSYDYLNGLPKRYEQLDISKVRQAAQEMFDPASYVWVVSGDLAKTEAPIRALGIAPVEVRNEQGEVIR